MIHNSEKKIGYILSGNGSVAECCMKFVDEYKIGKNAFVFSDRKCPALEKAENNGIEWKIIDEDWKIDREKACNQILKICKEKEIDFLFLNFNRLLTGKILHDYEDRIINLHLSFLPAFKGLSSIEDAIKFGSRYIGATTHFIDESMDGGKIILQGLVPLDPSLTIDQIRSKHYEMLKIISLETIFLMLKEQIVVEERRVFIKNANYNNFPVNPISNDSNIANFLDRYDK